MQAMQTVEETKIFLLEKQKALQERIIKIQSSKKRDEPLSADSSEQSIELENSEVIDALDLMENKDLELVNNALARIESGKYGQCIECNEFIGQARLKALPFTPVCLNCAQEPH